MQTPQQLSQQAMEEFRAIYEAEFKQRLTDDEVREIALRLLRFFGILLKPVPENMSDEDGSQHPAR
jgi:hypothetical protein